MSVSSSGITSVTGVIRSILVSKIRFCHSLSDAFPKYHYPTKEEESELYRRLRCTVAPWQILPYEYQLEKLQKRATVALVTVKNMLLNCKGSKHLYMRHFKNFGGMLPCELLPVQPSPVHDHYRNKDTFVIGQGVDKSPDVGFYIPPGKFPDMDVCGLPLKMQKEQHIAISQTFRKLVHRSDFPAIGFKCEKTGGWKTILIRSNQKGEALVGICVSPFHAARDTLDRVRDFIYEFFVNGEGSHFGIISLHHQEMAWINLNPTPDMSYKHLHGRTYLSETLLGKEFQIHPQSFFQCNLKGAEVLYKAIEELCHFKDNTVLLDVCCGTGTIGILLSDKVKKVYGIERVQAAVDDAKENCRRNGISNTEYFVGVAEHLLPEILASRIEEGDDIVTVLNPGRGGVGKNVTKTLRSCENIKRIVFASCKPLGRTQFNIVELCCPTDDHFPGKPFLPVKAIPVDMFPHTRHYELVVLFER